VKVNRLGGVTEPAARRLAPADRRRQLLGVAKSLLESHSIDDISVETVAAAAGVSPGLLFHYFGTQRKFRHAVIQNAARELLAQLRPDPWLSPAEQLHAAIETFAVRVAQQPRLYLAVVRSSSDRSNGDLSSLHRRVRAVLADWLTSGLAQAGVPITPAVTISVTGWLAFAEEALVTWVTSSSAPADNGPVLSTEELVALCERACYRLLADAINDRDRWAVIEQAITRAPSAAPHAAPHAVRRPSAAAPADPRAAP
jgi:AcrR family transcriptional regulator